MATKTEVLHASVEPIEYSTAEGRRQAEAEVQRLTAELEHLQG